MKVLGIRNSPKVIRFCILDGDATNYYFSNASEENKIDLPKSLKTEAEIYQWVKSEFSRLFDKYGPFDHMAIKQNENVPTRYSSVKPVMFLDCIACLVAIENNAPFSSHLYTSLGTKSKEVVKLAETQVTKSNTHWDSKMADAVLAAIKNIK
ncbi:hypothetical protein [uncultured Maribacter sp.]|uniref:hypothetical protein n=1 Tax=uncultured Maribacter sp. TaxID=431308 RepID=UPI00261D6E13|nr:hypothetical protein [uncultured Maribacter sp.]